MTPNRQLVRRRHEVEYWQDVDTMLDRATVRQLIHERIQQHPRYHVLYIMLERDFPRNNWHVNIKLLVDHDERANAARRLMSGQTVWQQVHEDIVEIVVSVFSESLAWTME